MEREKSKIAVYEQEYQVLSYITNTDEHEENLIKDKQFHD